MGVGEEWRMRSEGRKTGGGRRWTERGQGALHFFRGGKMKGVCVCVFAQGVCVFLIVRRR